MHRPSSIASPKKSLVQEDIRVNEAKLLPTVDQ